VRASINTCNQLESSQESGAILLASLDYGEGVYKDASMDDILQAIRQWYPALDWQPLEDPDGPDLRALMSTRLTELTYLSEGFLRALNIFSADRRYFRSGMGYVGWVPRHAQSEDLICAFSGSRFPFVIRPFGEGYRLIGACYLHGIMEGQVCEIESSDGLGDRMLPLI